MPYISTKTNVEISKEKEEIIKEKFGKAIELLPGKTETYLMLAFEGNSRLWFGGDNSTPIAYVEVKIFGKAAKIHFDALTGSICKIINEELDVPYDKIYVKYEEVEYWGWNGRNF